MCICELDHEMVLNVQKYICSDIRVEDGEQKFLFRIE